METNMNELKREVKTATLCGVGERMEVLREAARIEVSQWQGAKQALHELARKLEAHLAVVDRDADEGKLDDAQRATVKRYVDQCGGMARNLALAAEVQLFQAQGKVLALDRALLEVQQAYERAKAKSEAIAAAEAETAPVGRAVGQHPGDPLQERREEARRRRKRSHSHAKPRAGTAHAENA